MEIGEAPVVEIDSDLEKVQQAEYQQSDDGGTYFK